MGSIEPEDAEFPPEQEEAQQEASSEAERQRFRYRITFSKDGPLRYTSQLDLARIWERVLRRARLPLIYSQGFNPRPKIQLAVGLPLGCVSRCEIVDVWLEQEIADLLSVVEVLDAASPQGLSTGAIEAVDVHAPALQSVVWSALYSVTFRDAPDGASLAQRTAELLAQSELWHDRRGKRVNLRPLIDHLRVVTGPKPGLEMELAASPVRGTARPDEILQALGIDVSSAFVMRTAIHFEHEDMKGTSPESAL